jgi:hypothetical protein
LHEPAAVDWRFRLWHPLTIAGPTLSAAAAGYFFLGILPARAFRWFIFFRSCMNFVAGFRTVDFRWRVIAAHSRVFSLTVR